MAKSARTDYHIHPDYSTDASPVKIYDYCYRALELGFTEICFTTHLELDPIQHCSPHDLTWLDSYFNEIVQAEKDFKASGLKVKAGIEVGYKKGLEKDIEKIVKEYPFDFVLGAIHRLNNISISSMKESPLYFRSRSLAELRFDYFTTLKEAVKSGLFDSIAHIDIYRRYGIKHYGPDVLTVHRGVIEPIFKEMARKGMGLEINTSSRRRGLKEFHPSREIISLAAKAGIKVFTVGSDAHSLDELGDNIEEALTLLENFNLYNHVFTRRRAVPCLHKTIKSNRNGQPTDKTAASH
ncbi:MAG: histidinol-phosphatase family [Thermosediminibacterales bacterium]|nr:histidinol-phosphatase family [Thermosediminibacterales bacterium]